MIATMHNIQIHCCCTSAQHYSISALYDTVFEYLFIIIIREHIMLRSPDNYWYHNFEARLIDCVVMDYFSLLALTTSHVVKDDDLLVLLRLHLGPCRVVTRYCLHHINNGLCHVPTIFGVPYQQKKKIQPSSKPRDPRWLLCGLFCFWKQARVRCVQWPMVSRARC